MGAAHGIAESFMKLIRQHPRYAFILIPASAVMIYMGMLDTRLIQNVDMASPVTMEVKKVWNAGGETLFPRFLASGKTSAGSLEVEVSLFKHEFKKLKPGDKIEVFATGIDDQPWVTRAKAESNVLFRAGNVVISGVIVFGVILGLIGLGWGIFMKPKNS